MRHDWARDHAAQHVGTTRSRSRENTATSRRSGACRYLREPTRITDDDRDRTPDRTLSCVTRGRIRCRPVTHLIPGRSILQHVSRPRRSAPRTHSAAGPGQGLVCQSLLFARNTNSPPIETARRSLPASSERCDRYQWRVSAGPKAVRAGLTGCCPIRKGTPSQPAAASPPVSPR